MPRDINVPLGTGKRLFDILEIVKRRGPIGVSEISAELDIPTSTTNDYLQTLTKLGYLARIEGGYRLGLRFLDLGGAARDDRQIMDVAEQEIDRLARDTGEHANLMIAEDGRGIFVYKATGENAVELDTRLGMVIPLHTTALGKAIMAYMEPSRVQEIIDRYGLKAVTDRTITDAEALFEELERIREEGIARDDEERVEGMRCAAAPIFLDGDVVVAVSSSGPVTRFQGDTFQHELPGRVQSAANVIEVNIKHS